jgi:hypothetical protein
MDTNIEYWGNDPDGGKPKYFEITCPNDSFFHYKPHMDCPEDEPVHPTLRSYLQ